MNKARLLLIGLAVASAVGAAMVAKNMIMAKPPQEAVQLLTTPITKVLVANKDLVIGERLGDLTTTWRDWPKAQLGEGMITQEASPNAIEDMKLSRAKLPIYAGEPIIPKKLVSPGERGFMSAILPKGMRAISVAISERSAVSGFILPNDRVDVILTRRGNAIAQSETVLSNVRVLAINQTFRQEGEDKVTVTEGKTAVLELDPEQAESITKVEASGELSLALRSIAEGGDAGLTDEKPVFHDPFPKQAQSAGPLIIRYGIETAITSR